MLPEPEWLTRKKRIDTKLLSLEPAWKIVHYREGMDLSRLDCHAVEEFLAARRMRTMPVIIFISLLHFRQQVKFQPSLCCCH